MFWFFLTFFVLILSVMQRTNIDRHKRDISRIKIGLPLENDKEERQPVGDGKGKKRG